MLCVAAWVWFEVNPDTAGYVRIQLDTVGYSMLCYTPPVIRTCPALLAALASVALIQLNTYGYGGI